MNDVNNLVSAIAGSKSSIAAKYLREGRHLLKVHTSKTGRNKDGRLTIIFEFQVVDTTNHEDHPIGSLTTLLYFGDSISGLKQAKTAICRILNIDECELTEEIIANALAPQEGRRFSPLRGILIEAVVEYVTTKKGGRYTQTTLYSCEQDALMLDDLDNY